MSTSAPCPGQPALVISAAQLIERDRWETALALGQCTLEEALVMVLHTGAPAGPLLVERVVAAFGNYSSGDFLADGQTTPKELATAFGSSKMGNEAQKIRAEIVCRTIYDVVISEHERYPKGHPKHAPLSRSDTRSDGAPETAFAKAAAIFKLAESTIINRYTAHLKTVTGA